MRYKLWQQLALAMLLATGVACLWGCLVGWGISIYQSKAMPYQTFESLRVNSLGEVYVRKQEYSRYHDTFSYQTLDGQQVEEFDGHNSWVSPASLSIPQLARSGEVSGDWSRRVDRVATTRSSSWFLVHNGEDEAGRAYLVGYDLLSKLPIGYFGRQGFQPELPTVDQWFAIDGRSTGYLRGAYAAGNGLHATMLALNGGIFTYQQTSSAKVAIVALATANGLVEIDLQNRSLKNKDDRGAYQSVANCRVPTRVISAELVPDGMDLNVIKHYGEDPEFDRYYKKVPLDTVVGRQRDRLVVFSPIKDEQYEFVIPPKLLSRNFSFYFLSPEQAVLDSPRSIMHGHTSDLFWISASGKIEKSAEVRLNAGRMVTDRAPFGFLCLLLPVPLAMVVMITGFVPFQHPYSTLTMQASTYLERLANVWSDAWLSVLLLVLVSALLAWWARRRHQKYSQPNRLAWGLFVFLLGLPAMAVYWILHRPPVREKCGECGEIVPRDRDSCAQCEKPFAEPALLGTEILA